MPYTPEHRAQTRAKIVTAARQMFNLHGFDGVSIDQIMAHAGLSRGGFYHHFVSKEALFAEAVVSFLDTARPAELTGPALIRAAMTGYLSEAHLNEVADQCPMIAVPSDVARGGKDVRRSYQRVFQATLNQFETNLPGPTEQARQKALMLCILSIGGMILARTMEDAALSDEIRQAAAGAPDALGLD
ncbi:hypothetical protein ACMU_06305 [Actibacterium mucosum KCTC 23349]|uniref:HTH tetR-type domain-containing protein n=1 Tax=Actibacterium mucosum KCTC 23349 TaxID=1454373 RepID=A0A037ZJD6_9RHOB|nr:TetR/AcrR family transcriptional regulator [Actibacterium mucosum]KAJ56550.1 hypothetical protein ACMU_06305 [Actibacterium mucosum KCTC 23349]